MRHRDYVSYVSHLECRRPDGSVTGEAVYRSDGIYTLISPRH